MEHSVKKSEQYIRERNDLVAALEQNFGYVLQGRTLYNEFYESAISNLVFRHTTDVIPYNIFISLDPDERIPAIQEGIRRTKAALSDPESKEYAVFRFFREKESKFLANPNFQMFHEKSFGERLSEGLRLGGLLLLTGNSWSNRNKYESVGNHFDNEVFLSKHPDYRSLDVRGTWDRALSMMDFAQKENNRRSLGRLLGLKPAPPREFAELLCEISDMKVKNMRRLGDIEKEIGGSLSIDAGDGKQVEVVLDDSRYFKQVLLRTGSDITKAISSVRDFDMKDMYHSLTESRKRVLSFGDVVASWAQEEAVNKPLRPVSDALLTAYMENRAKSYERAYVEAAAAEQPEIAETIDVVRKIDGGMGTEASQAEGRHRLEFQQEDGSMKLMDISYDPDNDLYVVVGVGSGGRVQMKYDPRDDSVNCNAVGISDSLKSIIMPVLEECVRSVESAVRKQKEEERQKVQDQTFGVKM